VPPETTPAADRHLFASFAEDAAVDLQLFCFPYAGGGAQIFRGWQARVPPGVGVTGVRLPGREQRFSEPRLDTWPEALAELTAAIARQTERGPYAFFGHSLGARLAYELTHRLAAEGRRPPEALVVSACRAPGVPQRWPTMHTMDGPALAARLRQMNGVPEEVLANPQLMALFEPLLRADLRLAETWDASPGRVTAPILALCGDHDAVDPYEDMLDWRNHTAAGFAIRSFPAGHFFLRDEEEAVVSTITAHLQASRTR
jgi:medium-chain acyl-[acyl-carrier-protein] hydrolase